MILPLLCTGFAFSPQTKTVGHTLVLRFRQSCLARSKSDFFFRVGVEVRARCCTGITCCPFLHSHSHRQYSIAVSFLFLVPRSGKRRFPSLLPFRSLPFPSFPFPSFPSTDASNDKHFPNQTFGFVHLVSCAPAPRVFCLLDKIVSFAAPRPCPCPSPSWSWSWSGCLVFPARFFCLHLCLHLTSRDVHKTDGAQPLCLPNPAKKTTW